LISLDSDERIQGNPRKSNLIIGVFATKRRLAKKTQTGSTERRRDCRREGAKRTPSKGTAL
jgi:hypothetical protein